MFSPSSIEAKVECSMSKKRPGGVELEEGGAERHQQDVGSGQAVDREIAERRRGIEHDDVVGVEDAVALEGVARAPPRASSRAGDMRQTGIWNSAQ